MFEGFLSFGGNELINSARALGYTSTSGCGVSWLQCPPCDGIAEVLGEELAYDFANISDAPWYDVEDEPTHRFYGVSGLRVEGMTDSTRTAEVAESIGNGGVVSKPRHGTRRVRVEATLTAQGEDALEAGLAWLNAALIPRNCSVHGESCGAADVKFFTACPPERSDILMPQPIWNDPITNVATNPSFETPGTAVELFRNLAPYPSMELAAAATALRTNLATNPSFEATTAATVEVRRNLIINPRMENAVNGWTISGVATQTAQAGGTKLTFPADVAPSTSAFFYSDYIAAVAGEYSYAAMDVTVPAGQPAASVQVGLRVYGPSPTQIVTSYSPVQVIQPGTTVRLTAPPVLATGAADNYRLVLVPAATLPLGSFITVRNAIVEKTPTVGTYFDGATVPAGDFTHAWAGTANASASVQYGTAVPGVTGSNSKIVQSTEWASSGVKSVRIISSAIAAGQAFAVLHTLTAADVGKTYTVVLRVRVTAPYVSSPNVIHRSLFVVQTGATNVQGPQVPNVPGVYELRWTHTVAAGTTGGNFRFYHGGIDTDPNVWWDDLLVVEGTYTGPYFDGSTPPKARRNLATRPQPGNGGWASNNVSIYGAPTPDTTYIRRAGTTSAKSVRPAASPSVTLQSLYSVGIPTWNTSGWVKVSPGQVITASAYASADVPFRAQISGVFYSAGSLGLGGGGAGAWTPNTPASNWARASVTLTAPADAAYFAVGGFFIEKTGGESVGGEQCWAQDALYEISPTLGSYFDGGLGVAPYSAAWEMSANNSPSYLYDSDFTYTWTGTANASTSVQNSLPVAGYGVSGGVVAFQSKTYVQSGVASARTIANSGTTSGELRFSGGNTTTFPLGMVAGKTYTVMVRMYIPVPNTVNDTSATSRQRRITWFYSINANPAYTPAYGPQAPNTAGWHTLVHTFTIPTDATGGILGFGAAGNGAGAVEHEAWWDDAIVVEGQYIGGSYFDGSTVIFDPDITTAWVGTPHASASVRTGVGVAAVTGGIGGLVIQSTEWTRSRAKSLRLIPSGKSSNVSYAAVGGGSGGFRFGMQPDHTYTVMVHLHLDTPQVGSLVEYARTVRANFKVDGAVVSVSSAPAPNVPGDYGLNLTFTVPWNATEAYIRLYNGSDDVTDDVWFDDFLFIEGDYSGAYFDGESPDSTLDDYEVIGMPLTQHEWTGTPEASTSTRANGMVIAVEDPVAWQKAIDGLTRFMHTSTAVSGPTIVQKLHRGQIWGYVVEFVLVSAVGWTFGVTRPVTGADNPSIPSVVQDTPFNLVPYPSAELTSGTVVAATNYVTNPSAEVAVSNIPTGWGKSVSVIPTNDVAISQSTELKSVGTYSAKSLFTATGSGTSGFFGVQVTVDPLPIATGQRYSVSFWASASVESGTIVLGNLEYHVYWMDTGGATIRDDILATLGPEGGAVSVASILPPAGTVKALVRALQRVTSWSTGAKARVYMDAAAVTTP